MPNITSGCIEFSGGRRKKSGYGYTQFMSKQVLAHRLAFALNEMIPIDALKGVVIRHKCDNPSCVNVEHLEPGTTQDNTNDKVARGRHLYGSLIGNSKLTELQVAEIRRSYAPYSKHANQYQLAAQFGVSQAVISLILSRKYWKKV